MTRKERAALAQDAARYRFIRENDDFLYRLLESLQQFAYVDLELWQLDMDEQIDSAIKSLKKRRR